MWLVEGAASEVWGDPAVVLYVAGISPVSSPGMCCIFDSNRERLQARYGSNLCGGGSRMRRRIYGNVILLTQLLIALLIVLLLCPKSIAQSDDQSRFVIPVGEVRVLELDTEITFFAPGVAEVLAGRTAEQTWNMVVSSNTDWILTIRGSDEYWDGPWQKPVSDILWRHEMADFIPLSTEPAVVSSGGMADHVAYPIEFSISLNMLNDIPGDYFYGYVVFEFASP